MMLFFKLILEREGGRGQREWGRERDISVRKLPPIGAQIGDRYEP